MFYIHRIPMYHSLPYSRDYRSTSSFQSVPPKRIESSLIGTATQYVYLPAFQTEDSL
jgi:hypothetical protein